MAATAESRTNILRLRDCDWLFLARLLLSGDLLPSLLIWRAELFYTFLLFAMILCNLLVKFFV